MLARDPSKIAVGDVIKAVRETIEPVFCVDNDSKPNKKCSREDQCVTRLVWKEAGKRIAEYFNSVNIGDLCKKAKSMGVKKEVKHPYEYNI